ncbi:hypothetical protein COLSTE_01918 [Collinsella stercoris DSM 13279]|uniref:Uncharacterized protein n=1 Tax=Collinsella stercoris DSM 13279 TaxID=445975 RepID=B6GCU3_9ACTN|nr:hypothetical protein COLSTE_01918 [Collinsella stercoris DSM 13279]
MQILGSFAWAYRVRPSFHGCGYPAFAAIPWLRLFRLCSYPVVAAIPLL